MPHGARGLVIDLDWSKWAQPDNDLIVAGGNLWNLQSANGQSVCIFDTMTCLAPNMPSSGGLNSRVGMIRDLIFHGPDEAENRSQVRCRGDEHEDRSFRWTTHVL